MYKIIFHDQPRQDMPDEEYNSIVVTDESYSELPVLDSMHFTTDCTFYKGKFSDQVRHEPENTFSALWIYNDEWKLETSPGDSGFIDSKINWVFVCLNEATDMWIAFEFYDIASWGDAYGSTVGVSYPRHGTVYRLSEEHMEIVRNYYP